MPALSNLLKDPPPTHAFELSEQGISFARIAEPGQVGFQPFPDNILVVSPVHDNIQKPDAFQQMIEKVAPPAGHRKRRAALILPDYCARIAVLDFDSFPTDPEQQSALLRFRMKKSVPFDVDTAVVSFAVQPKKKAKIEVLVAVISAEIASRYEAPFRAAGFHPGLVTLSSISALNLVNADAMSMLVKLSGKILSVLVLDGSSIKLIRSVDMEEGTPDEVEAVLHPTVAYIEDELKTKPKRIWLCGFGAEGEEFQRRWEAEWGVAVEPLRSRFGTPGRNSAGLMGYLESVA